MFILIWQTNNEQLTTKDFYVQNYFTEAVCGGLKICKWMGLNQLANKRLTNLIPLAGKILVNG